MAGRRIGNPLALAVLSYLGERPMHPYELSRTLRDRGEARSIKFNHGSLYMVVRQLAAAGFVAEVGTSREGARPERTVYEVTDAGRRELRDWLRELIEAPVHEYPQFVAALALIGALPPGEVRALLGTRLARIDATRDEIRALMDGALREGVHELFLVEEEYRLALLDAERAFVSKFIDRLDDPDGTWSRPWREYHERIGRESGGEPA